MVVLLLVAALVVAAVAAPASEVAAAVGGSGGDGGVGMLMFFISGHLLYKGSCSSQVRALFRSQGSLHGYAGQGESEGGQRLAGASTEPWIEL